MPLDTSIFDGAHTYDGGSSGTSNTSNDISYISNIGIYTFQNNFASRTKISNDINYDINKSYTGINSIKGKLFTNSYLVFKKEAGASINAATLRLKVGGTTVFEITFNSTSYGASKEWWFAIPLETNSQNAAFMSSTNDFTDDGNWSGNPTYATARSSSTLFSFDWMTNSSFSSPVTLPVTMEIANRDGYEKICDIKFLAPLLNSISLDTTNVQKTFYKNQAFNYDNLVVTATYQYQVGLDYETKTITNYSISSPNMASSGLINVIVSYNSKVTSYTITIYKASGISSNLTATNLKKNEDDPKSLFSNNQITITYDDGTTETQDLTNDMFTTLPNMATSGEQDLVVTTTAIKTNEEVSKTFKVNVIEVQSISITAYPTKRVYTGGQTLDTNGLEVTANFGDAGTKVVTDYTCSTLDSSSSGKKTITVTYDGKTATFEVAVSGLSSVSVDLSGVNDGTTAKFYKETYLSGYYTDVNASLFSIKSKVKVNYTETTYTFSSGDFTSTDSTGTKTSNDITFTNSALEENAENNINAAITISNITLSEDFKINTYYYLSIEVEGVKTPVYSGKLEITDDVKVKGIKPDNSKVELNSTQYSISPSANSNLSLGVNTITFTSTENTNISTTTQVESKDDEPVANATLSTSGGLDKAAINSKYYYSVGQTIDTSGLNLIVSEMKSGLKNLTLTDRAYNKRLYKVVDNEEVDHTGLTFNDNDTTGNYILELSFADLEPITYDIVLDYVTSVSVNTSTSKLVYKAGESLDISTIKGTKTFASGNTADLVSTDIEALSHTFSKADTSDTDSEEEELTLTICGFEEDITFTIICIKSLAINLSSTAHNIHDSLKITSIVATYSDDTTTRNLTDNEIKSISWTTNSATIDINNLTTTNIRTVNEHTLTASYTETGITLTATKTITIKALKTVQLVDSNSNVYSKVVLDYGDEIKSIRTNYLIKATFNDDTTLSNETISTSKDIFTSNNENLTNTNQKCISRITNAYIAYQWISSGVIVDNLNCTFDIYCMKLVSLSLSWGDINSTHYVGDTLPINSITSVQVTYSALLDGETYDSTYVRTDLLGYNNLSYSIDNGISINNFTYTFTEAKNYTLVAAYTANGLTETTTKSITVENIQLNSITVTHPQSFSSSFKEEQMINLTSDNTTIMGNYNNGDREISLDSVNFYEKVNDEYVTFNINKRLTILDDEKVIYVEYGLFPEVYGELLTLSVGTKTLSSITVETAPTKTEYTIGDLFSLDGIVVKATFDNGTTDLIDKTNLSVSGIVTNRALVSTDITQEETITITLSYTYGGVTKTATISVDLVYPTIDHLRINTSYATTIFTDGDTFTSTGLLVYAIFENGYEEQLQSTSYSLNTSDFVSSTTIGVPTNTDSGKKEYGLYIIPVTATNPYKNSDTNTNTTDYKISILSSASIEQTFLRYDEGYESYVVGDIFTAKGVHYWVKDGDGNEFEVDFETNPTKNTLLKKAQKMQITAYFANNQPQTFNITVNVAYSTSLIQSYNYKIAIGDINGNLFTSITHDEATIELGVKENGEITYPIFKADYVAIDTNVAHSLTYGYNVFNDVMANATSKCIGYMEMGVQDDYGNVIKNAHIVLFDDPINPIAGDGNVVVKYPHYVEGYSDKINKCQFGIIYNKHLFVSGNPEFKNCDWHTENINVAQVEDYNQTAESDYTYFSDLDYCYYGTDDTKIVGYDIYRDGDLVVVKESSRTQATLYRREAKLITAIDSQGNTLTGYYEDAYPSFDINFNGGDGGLSNRSIINFMGDTLFLTKNGLKVLSSKDTTYNKEKIVYDVSSYINPRILKENLEDGYLFTYKEKLLLKTNRGIYVGEYTLRNDNKEYEWYFIDNVEADLFFEYDDELYFMNDKGGFYKFSFDENKYKDNSRVFIGVGGTLLTNIANDDDGFDLDSANDRIIVSNVYANDVEEGKEFHLITSYESESQNKESLIHANIGSFIEKQYRKTQMASNNSFNASAYTGIINTDTNTLEVKVFDNLGNENTLETMKANDMIYTNKNIYVDFTDVNYQNSATTNAPVIDTKYKLVKYNDEVFDYRYKLVNAQTNVECDLSEMLTMRLSYLVNELEITKITNVESYGTGKSFQLLGEHDKVLDLIYYNQRNNKYSAVITNQNIVKSFFITKPYDMGTILYEKTIWQWAIANDTELASYMDVGYLTSKKQGDYDLVIKTASGSKAYNYNDNSFSFDKIQFTSDKLPHIYNRFRVLANIGFIRFIFKNFEDSNIVLDKLSLIYTISQAIKGVK